MEEGCVLLTQLSAMKQAEGSGKLHFSKELSNHVKCGSGFTLRIVWTITFKEI